MEITHEIRLTNEVFNKLTGYIQKNNIIDEIRIACHMLATKIDYEDFLEVLEPLFEDNIELLEVLLQYFDSYHSFDIKDIKHKDIYRQLKFARSLYNLNNETSSSNPFLIGSSSISKNKVSNDIILSVTRNDKESFSLMFNEKSLLQFVNAQIKTLTDSILESNEKELFKDFDKESIYQYIERNRILIDYLSNKIENPENIKTMIKGVAASELDN